jgi:hypothetical protein
VGVVVDIARHGKGTATDPMLFFELVLEQFEPNLLFLRFQAPLLAKSSFRNRRQQVVFAFLDEQFLLRGWYIVLVLLVAHPAGIGSNSSDDASPRRGKLDRNACENVVVFADGNSNSKAVMLAVTTAAGLWW